MSNKREYTDDDIEVDIEDFYYDEDVPEGKKPKKPRKVKSVKDYLKTHKKDATYKRVARGAKAHPGASLYELQHGVRSAASKAYRGRQAAPFAGRVDHEAIHKAVRESGYVVLKDGDYAPGPITATHGNKVVLYGGLLVYHPERDKHQTYDRLTEGILSEIKMRLHKVGK